MDHALRRFFDAIAAGDEQAVRASVATRPDLVRAHDPRNFGATPLNAAVCAGNAAMLDVLLELGADIDALSDWWAGGFAPIHCALMAPGAPMAPLLIARGARVDAHAAAGLGMFDPLRALLDADPTLVAARAGDGQMPLHYATTPAIADLLLDRGAPIDALDVDHDATPAQYAAKARPAVARRLVARGAATDLFMIAAIGDAPAMRAELARDPSRRDARLVEALFPPPPGARRGPAGGHIYLHHFGRGATPLHVAVGARNAEAARVLLEAGADVNAAGGYDDATPLHVAAWEDAPEMAALLLDAGAAIDRPSGHLHHNSPLGWAIVGAGAAVVELLLARGAVVAPHHREDARRALAGEFNWVNRGAAADRARIAAMIGAA